MNIKGGGGALEEASGATQPLGQTREGPCATHSRGKAGLPPSITGNSGMKVAGGAGWRTGKVV